MPFMILSSLFQEGYDTDAWSLRDCPCLEDNGNALPLLVH